MLFKKILCAIALGLLVPSVPLAAAAEGLQPNLESDNYYEVLGVAQDATPREIITSYRALARLHHPDRGGERVAFEQIQRAYEVLRDPRRRENYNLVNFFIDTVLATYESGGGLLEDQARECNTMALHIAERVEEFFAYRDRLYVFAVPASLLVLSEAPNEACHLLRGFRPGIGSPPADLEPAMTVAEYEMLLVRMVESVFETYGEGQVVSDEAAQECFTCAQLIIMHAFERVNPVHRPHLNSLMTATFVLSGQPENALNFLIHAQNAAMENEPVPDWDHLSLWQRAAIRAAVYTGVYLGVWTVYRYGGLIARRAIKLVREHPVACAVGAVGSALAIRNRRNIRHGARRFASLVSGGQNDAPAEDVAGHGER